MARPRKNPDDPKWAVQNVGTSEQVPAKCGACGCAPKAGDVDPWQVYFAAALTGLIARGGASMESLIKTARMYADEAIRATGEAP